MQLLIFSFSQDNTKAQYTVGESTMNAYGWLLIYCLFGVSKLCNSCNGEYFHYLELVQEPIK